MSTTITITLDDEYFGPEVTEQIYTQLSHTFDTAGTRLSMSRRGPKLSRDELRARREHSATQFNEWMSVQCWTCGSQPGQPCTNRAGDSVPPSATHAVRRHDAADEAESLNRSRRAMKRRQADAS